MINLTLIWILLVPIILSAITIVLLPKLDGTMNYGQSSVFAGGGLLIAALIMSGAFYMGKGAKTDDTELWNGQITAKHREHDSYQRSYSCNCTTSTDSSGRKTESCQTCYEDHYTVKWSAKSTVGSFTIRELDETSRSVYQTPDPRFYTQIQIGEPCSTEHHYTNYIKAVPESLFRPTTSELKSKFQGMIPAYPSTMYDMWKVDRVLPVKVAVPNIHEWSDKLSNSLKTLGPKKQANAIILLVNSSDPAYAYALQDAWLGGKKNDIIVIIGTTNFPAKADWVSVLALTDNEMFKIRLRDDILALDSLTADSVVGTLHKDTLELFQRKPMKDFAYLDAEIDPPDWVNVTTVIIVCLAYGGFWLFAWRQASKFTSSRRAGYNSYRSRRF